MAAKKKKELICTNCETTDTNDQLYTAQNGQTMCTSCINYPFDVLQRAFHAKNFKEAKAIILEFDEQCEQSFLEVKHV